MSPRRRERVPTPELLSFLDDELGPDEKAAVERISVDSASVRQRLEALRGLRRALGAPVPALEGRELDSDLHAEAERLSQQRSNPSNQRPSPRSDRVGRGGERVPRAWFVFAASALLLLGVGLGQLYPRPEEFPSARDVGARPKAASPAASPARWEGIRAFRLVPGGQPERLRKSVRSEDGLLFAYTNLGAEPFEHLMVFCVDAEREVHWFYPAYASEHENPSSIPVQVGQELALSEVVWLDLPKGPLTIYGAFTREPLDVWAVEAWFEAHPGGGAGFAGAGAAVSQLAVTVE
jgi:hypothetical protein